MKISNTKIYSIVEKYYKEFIENENSIYLPVKVNFYIQKNWNKLKEIYENIDSVRARIIKQYGEAQDDGSYNFKGEFKDKANKELKELGELEQDIEFDLIDLEDIGELKLTTKQLEALMFMIKENY